MSPEQCKGQPLDQRSDIYSFGCLMYEVITGKTAARADSVLETLMLHVNGLNLDFDNTPPAVILKESAHKKSSAAVGEYKCFNGLRRVIETCTATDPEKRYPTAYRSKVQSVEKNPA
jgi:serine/threonine protein kinase